MAPLPKELRKKLESAVIDAREIAEEGAQAALAVLAVRDEKAPPLTNDQRDLRNGLRARWRTLTNGDRDTGWKLLYEEIAYEQWHRMLFARFLAENNLLMHPEYSTPVTLEDCAELVEHEGETDAWAVAAKYASRMLPGIFRNDDPAVRVRFAAEHMKALEGILSDLPPVLFTADDALGWVYQFWQTKAKEEVNKSGRKIGGADLPPVTQLFTEHYMVRFLLENSLGAWWAGRHPNSPLLKEWEYLRYREDGMPAAGTFAGWPNAVAEVTMMDPCCGSGHFLVTAADMLRKMRMEEEDFNEQEASEAVLRDNLFGLELDPRCTQIAAFALALDAWKHGGYRELLLPHVACSGIHVAGQLEEWTSVAADDVNLRSTLERLYWLFKDAPDLGSLIDPTSVDTHHPMLAQDIDKVMPVLSEALKKASTDPVAQVFGAAAEGAASAGRLLAAQYVLVATNVPYLRRGKQTRTLSEHLRDFFPKGKNDLATAFLERIRKLARSGGSYALVTPQNWLFLGSYVQLRIALLKEQQWNFLCRLGPGAFETISGEVVNVILFVATDDLQPGTLCAGIDASQVVGADNKASALRSAAIAPLNQAAQLENPDGRISLDGSLASEAELLSTYASFGKGSVTGDSPHYLRKFWELPSLRAGYRYWLNSPDETKAWTGREHVVLWKVKGHEIELELGLAVRGQHMIGRRGVAIGKSRTLYATVYDGELFDDNVVVLAPKNEQHLANLWAFCTSAQFREGMRALDAKMAITAGTFVKVRFDPSDWTGAHFPSDPTVAEPTQWLSSGHPSSSTHALQVAVARLLGYRWPSSPDDALVSLADPDGIVCVPAVQGEQPAAERLRTVLARAFEGTWSQTVLDRLLKDAGSPGRTLERWLRDDFFQQHTGLFHHRPFVWQIWDGRADGFSALVNYHKLDHATLQKLTHSTLGSWIERQRDEEKSGTAGAEARLVGALELQKKLALILRGEPPYDIYVRWKPLGKQAIGWEPDLDDGVRVNIRPFVTAGVLRSKFAINWSKDRGTNPDGTSRENDKHCTIAEKQAATRKAGS